jgi:hypothetical protein
VEASFFCPFLGSSFGQQKKNKKEKEQISIGAYELAIYARNQ